MHTHVHTYTHMHMHTHTHTHTHTTLATFGLYTTDLRATLAHHVLLLWLMCSQQIHQASHHRLLLLKVLWVRWLHCLVCLLLNQRRQQLQQSICLRCGEGRREEWGECI